MVMLYTLWGNPLSAGEDDVVYYYPLRVMVAEHLKAGELPLYNPREATGMPLMADPQTAVMHPATWLFVVLPPKLAYSLSIFAAFSLAGGGAYLYLRRLGLVRAAALFGAIAFMFCGFMVGHRVHLSMIQAAAMLPWGLWCIEGLRRRNNNDLATETQRTQSRKKNSNDEETSSSFLRDLRVLRGSSRFLSAVCLVPVVFLTIAAGHWPTLIHMALVWTVYGLIRVRPLLPGLALGAAAVALAAIMAWPQVHITSQLLAEVTRNKIGYATAGENSFLPTSAVLDLMPFFMGTRNPNFFSQPWWGSWHLCEMLGYVGLVTLALALGAMWRLYRKGTRQEAIGTRQTDVSSLVPSAYCLVPSSSLVPSAQCLVPVVRCWTWITIGAGIFMLGYYLPTYKLLYMLPVMGVVRCPARMVLAVDLGLAVLAAVAIHCVLVAPMDDRVRRLRRTVIVLAVVVLPLTMFAMVRFWQMAGDWLLKDYPNKFPFLPFDGGAKAAIQAASIANPAVYIPAIMMAITAIVLVVWLRWKANPQSAALPLQSSIVNCNLSIRIGAILILLLLADLFWITRFVDVPAGRIGPGVETSPAAAWLRQHDPDVSSYRVWGLSKSYHDRPDELLLPKTCEAMGFSTIANYGPFQSPAQVQLFGFRPWGECHDWASLIKNNYLLSLYGVKYILAVRENNFPSVYSSVIEGAFVGISIQGNNLLGDRWQTEQTKWAERMGVTAQVRGKGADQTITLKTPFMFWPSQAWQESKVKVNDYSDRGYMISLDARAQEGGAAGFLRVEILNGGSRPVGLTVEAEQIGPEWRHFEGPAPIRFFDDSFTFRLVTLSERAIDVRNVSFAPLLRRRPLNLSGSLTGGENVYRKLVELPAVNPGDPPVAIYENRLWRSLKDTPKRTWGCHMEVPTNEQLEAVKYPPPGAKLESLPVPDISLRPVDNPAGLIWGLTLPAVGLYVLIVIVAVVRKPGRA
jgi:hypothetical protein